jgi:hypothetical protein
MDCRHVEFSPTKSQERINKALLVFPRALLMRLLAFSLHLLGAERKAVAALVGMPEQSVKTVVRLAMCDGFPALRDRRGSGGPPVAKVSPSSLRITARRQGGWYLVEFGPSAKVLRIPFGFRVQAKTVLLSLVNAGVLSCKRAPPRWDPYRTLPCALPKAAGQDVVESLVDKRQGQKRDYLVGSQQKAEIIQQLAARAITGRSTSSDVLAEAVNKRTQARVSARAVRWHIQKLGLTHIKQSLPQLVETLKKTPELS